MARADVVESIDIVSNELAKTVVHWKKPGWQMPEGEPVKIPVRIEQPHYGSKCLRCRHNVYCPGSNFLCPKD